MTAYLIPVPPGWTTRAPDSGELLRADTEGASMTAALRPLSDPRRLIPEQVRAAAGGPGPVTTNYLDLPLGRGILAEAGGERAVAQLWVPLPGGPDALVLTVVADDPERTAAVAHLATRIGAGLTADDDVVHSSEEDSSKEDSSKDDDEVVRHLEQPREENHRPPACLAS